ncbi:MAG: DsbA family protein [Chloroflexi bacterium]|nr:DsbA family protein [Chloroflexota bacterium]MDA1270576.1 DsbA family protein [Chloroflexota bacterium]PKB59742.1 MAG: hypothetical protein BZY83_00255 [SAR202 cluster bacterium Casp-Chloro-G2]
MPSVPVTVWFDYTCPHSYIGLARLDELASVVDIEVDRRPFLARPELIDEGYAPNPIQQQEVPLESRRRPLYKPGESIGTEPASNRSLSTLLVHAATAYAKELGLDGRFFRAASKEYWEQGSDLGSLYTMRRLAGATGLDWADLWPKLESGTYQESVLSQHQAAKAAGIARAPSFRANGALHSGNISFEQLKAAVLRAR